MWNARRFINGENSKYKTDTIYIPKYTTMCYTNMCCIQLILMRVVSSIFWIHSKILIVTNNMNVFYWLFLYILSVLLSVTTYRDPCFLYSFCRIVFIVAWLVKLRYTFSTRTLWLSQRGQLDAASFKCLLLPNVFTCTFNYVHIHTQVGHTCWSKSAPCTQTKQIIAAN